MSRQKQLSQIEDLEKAVASMQRTIVQLAAQINLASDDGNAPGGGSQDDPPVVSSTVSKPRTFEEITYLQRAVGNYYDQRCGKRMRELEELAAVDQAYNETGILEPPADMETGIEMWDLYIDLLKQYCDDVSDLLVYSKQRVE